MTKMMNKKTMDQRFDDLEGRLAAVHRILIVDAEATEDTRIRTVAAELAVRSVHAEDTDEQLTKRMEAIYDFISGPDDAVLVSGAELKDLRKSTDVPWLICDMCGAGPFDDDELITAHKETVCAGNPYARVMREEDFEAAYVAFRDQQLNAVQHTPDCSLNNEPAGAARPCDCGRVYVAVAYRAGKDLDRSSLDEPDGKTALCDSTSADGLRCKLPDGHTGHHYSRLATEENLAKCLAVHPNDSTLKCQRKVTHEGPHEAAGRSWAHRPEPKQ